MSFVSEFQGADPGVYIVHFDHPFPTLEIHLDVRRIFKDFTLKSDTFKAFHHDFDAISHFTVSPIFSLAALIFATVKTFK